MNNNQHSTVRFGESINSIPTRSDRFFDQEAYWYFRTREGLDIGPYDSRDAATQGLNDFLAYLQQAHANVVTRLTQYIKHQPRKGEPSISNEHSELRTERFFEQEHYWYFRTREGMDIGPFDNRGNAALGAKGFIGFLEESQPELVSKVTSYIRAV